MWHDGGIEDRGHAAFEFAKLRQHFRREGNRRVRILLRDNPCRVLFMQGIGIGVQKHYCKRRQAELSDVSHCPPAVILVERRQHLAGHVDALTNLEDAIWRHRPYRFDPAVQIPLAWDVVTPDLQYVLKPFGGEETHRRRLALQDGIRGGSRAVKDAHDSRWP
jgi:hypothetical protein